MCVVVVHDGVRNVLKVQESVDERSTLPTLTDERAGGEHDDDHVAYTAKENIRFTAKMQKSYFSWSGTNRCTWSLGTVNNNSSDRETDLHVCVANGHVQTTWTPQPQGLCNTITYPRRTTLATPAFVTTVKMVALLTVYMAFTSLAMFTPVAKMIQVSVCHRLCVTLKHCTNFSIHIPLK